MKIMLLKLEEVANLIEQAELSGNIVQQQQTPNEVIYCIQDGTNECLLINTPCNSYLITHSDYSNDRSVAPLSFNPPKPNKCRHTLRYS